MTNSIKKTNQNKNITNFSKELIQLLNKYDFKINSCHLALKKDYNNQVIASIWSNKNNYQIKLIETKEWLNLND